MSRKKVISIAGTSRSGSTLLNLILANDSRGESLGEVYALFKPRKKHHFKLLNSLRNNQSIWADLISGGEDQLYPKFFEVFKEKDIVVDSSKNPFWIKNQERISNNNDIDYKKVLIYKTPYEVANSFLKRGKPWVNHYIKYHRKYYSLHSDFYVTSYKDLVTQKKCLIDLCNWLEISYSDEKFEYWKKEHIHFFGSRTPNRKKSISYDAPDYPDLDRIVNVEFRQNTMIEKVWNVLETSNGKVIDKEGSKFIKSITYTDQQLFIQKWRNYFKSVYKYFFPGELLKANEE